MRKHTYFTLINFNEKHSLTKNHIHIQKRNNPDGFKKVEGKTFVDENFFIRRQEFRRKVWLESHDFYYWLSKHFIDNHIARLFALMEGDDSDKAVNSWNMFLRSTLFYRQETSIFSYSISPTFWKFWRYARWIFNHFHKIRGVNIRDIERYLV